MSIVWLLCASQFQCTHSVSQTALGLGKMMHWIENEKKRGQRKASSPAICPGMQRSWHGSLDGVQSTLVSVSLLTPFSVGSLCCGPVSSWISTRDALKCQWINTQNSTLGYYSLSPDRSWLRGTCTAQGNPTALFFSCSKYALIGVKYAPEKAFLYVLYKQL